MFTELAAAYLLDPMSDPGCQHEDHRRTNCPYEGFSSVIGSLPEIQLTGHLQRKSLNGQRITLNKVVNGKPHYIGPAGVIS